MSSFDAASTWHSTRRRRCAFQTRVLCCSGSRWWLVRNWSHPRPAVNFGGLQRGGLSHVMMRLSFSSSAVPLSCPRTNQFSLSKRIYRPVRLPLAALGPSRTTASTAASAPPGFFTPLRPLAVDFFQRTFLSTVQPTPLPTMASAPLDESLVTYLKTHAPNNAAAETDAVKASQALFPETTYTDAEKAELSQWLISASHIASSSDDAAKSAERLSSLNTHLASRTTVLGAKPSVADIALYQKLAPVVSKWSVEERTGEQGYHHIVRHVDFVQNSPVFGLKLDDKVNIELDNVIFKIKPVDAKAEKERKKKEKEAAAAAASGATPTTLTGEKGAEGKASKKDKVKDKAQVAGEAVVSTVTGNPSKAGPPEGAPTQKKEKKAKQPKPQKP